MLLRFELLNMSAVVAARSKKDCTLDVLLFLQLMGGNIYSSSRSESIRITSIRFSFDNKALSGCTEFSVFCDYVGYVRPHQYGIAINTEHQLHSIHVVTLGWDLYTTISAMRMELSVWYDCYIQMVYLHMVVDTRISLLI